MHATRRAPSAPCLMSPATPAAEAGSQKTPSWAARKRYASRISASATARTAPCDAAIAFIASSQRAGLPIRIALAVDERGRPLRLPAEHPRPCAHLLEAAPVRGDVARVADRDAERVEVRPE